MTVGYARVSTREQFLENQIHLLKESGCGKMYTDIASGVREDREGLKEMISYLRPGDVVIVYKIDRIFRSLKNLVELIDYFNRHQVQFKSLSEPAFDTNSSNGKFLLQIFGAVAEFERNLISERTKKLCGVKRYIDVKKLYNKFAYNRWKQFILHRYGYESFSSCRALFEREVRELVRSASKPKEIFYDLVDFLAEKKIEIPGYYIFAEVITKALNVSENELIKIVDNALTAEQKELLDGFMYMQVDSSREISSQNPYLITH